MAYRSGTSGFSFYTFQFSHLCGSTSCWVQLSTRYHHTDIKSVRAIRVGFILSHTAIHLVLDLCVCAQQIRKVISFRYVISLFPFLFRIFLIFFGICNSIQPIWYYRWLIRNPYNARSTWHDQSTVYVERLATYAASDHPSSQIISRIPGHSDICSIGTQNI